MKKYLVPILAIAVAGFGVAALTPQAAKPAKSLVQTDKAPKATGPLSQAIVAGGFVYCSGPGGIEEQTRQVLKNLQAILEASGSSLDNVVKCTVLMTDLTEFAAMNKVYAEFFKAPCPARATFQISALALGVKIEIDCIAVKP
jgi:2-iminobutanoate/2-iminopropanoate deaminase